MKNSRSQLWTLRAMAVLSLGCAFGAIGPSSWQRFFVIGQAVFGGTLATQLLFRTRSVEVVERPIPAEENRLNLNA